MQIIFAVSANPKDGLGHFMRSRALLFSLLEIRDDINVKYLCQCYGSLLEKYIWPKNSEQIRIKTNTRNSVIRLLIQKYLVCQSRSILIVDSYHFQKIKLISLTRANKSLLVHLDDVGSKKFESDLIVNQSTQDQNFYLKKEIKSKKFLIGSKYALTGNDYAVPLKKVSFEEINVIGIVMGGGGDIELINSIIKNIFQANKNFKISIVLGPFVDESRLLKTGNLNIVRAPKSLVNFIEECDLIITAAGSTVWEICAIGTPLIAIKVANNQREIINTILSKKIGYVLDALRLHKQLPVIIERMQKKYVREKIVMNQKKLIDGKGSGRVAKEIIDMAKHTQKNKASND